MLGWLSGCERGEPPKGGRLALEPASVNVGGVRLRDTRSDVEQRLGQLHCRHDDLRSECTWSPTKAYRERGFERINQLSFTFVRETLRRLTVHYSDMIDAEFDAFESDMKKNFGPPSFGPDSSRLWQSDSLSILLTPNRRSHWTRTVTVCAPVIDYRDRGTTVP